MKNPWKQYSKINPQREDGNRQIANDVFAALMTAELSGSEFRIVMAVINKTWGYGKESDCISTSQFKEMTGLAERTIKESIKILKEKRVLFYAPSNTRVRCGSPINEFLFNKHHDTWKTQGCKKVHGCTKTSNKGAENCNLRVRRSSPTKETLTKETITKDKAQKFPDWLPKELFDEYQASRKRKLKSSALPRFFSHLKKLCDSSRASPEAILNQSIVNGWEGIFELKANGGNGNGKHTGYTRGKPAEPELPADVRSMLDEVNARAAAKIKAEADGKQSQDTG